MKAQLNIAGHHSYDDYVFYGARAYPEAPEISELFDDVRLWETE